MSTPKDIDRNTGKLPQKEKGSLTPVMTSTIEETRRHQIERLAAAFRLFAHYGFDEGLAGHITPVSYTHLTLPTILLV